MKPTERDLLEIFLDFNSRLTEELYLLTDGSIADLEAAGLKQSTYVGKRFLFTEGNEPDDLAAEGVIVHHDDFGVVAKIVSDAIHNRSSEIQ